MLSQLKNTQEIDQVNRELDALTGSMENLDNITEQIYSSRERANASHKEVLEHKEMLSGALSEFDDSEKQNAEREKGFCKILLQHIYWQNKRHSGIEHSSGKTSRVLP